MKTIVPAALLRRALFADALCSGAVALVQLALSSWLSEHGGLPAPLLQDTGVFLIGYALLVGAIGRSQRVWQALVAFVIAGNLGWAALCVLLVEAHLVAPSGFGLAFLCAHVLVVVGFAVLEWRGLRQSVPSQAVGVKASAF
jgi:hypothetical protein